jgi:hypothetical protein
VADVLGISSAVVLQHYAKWSEARQERIDQVMGELHATMFRRPATTPRETIN